jgi:DNA-binding transcriptional ArsR family regulator
MELSKAQTEYLEKFGRMWEQTGLTHIGGKIFGYLLICDQPQVSFQDFVDVLGVSKASVSNNLKALLKIGFVEVVPLERSRKTYYKAAKIDMVQMMQERLALFHLFAEVMDEGLALKKNTADDASGFMQQTSHFYRWFARHMPEYLNTYATERSSKPS